MRILRPHLCESGQFHVTIDQPRRPTLYRVAAKSSQHPCHRRTHLYRHRSFSLRVAFRDLCPPMRQPSGRGSLKTHDRRRKKELLQPWPSTDIFFLLFFRLLRSPPPKKKFVLQNASSYREGRCYLSLSLSLSMAFYPSFLLSRKFNGLSRREQTERWRQKPLFVPNVSPKKNCIYFLSPPPPLELYNARCKQTENDCLFLR